MTFDSDVFASRELLVEALRGMGFEAVEAGESIPLEGWDRNDVRTADVVVRRGAFKEGRLFGDIGFKRTDAGGGSGGGFVAIVDDMDLTHNLGSDFLVRLKNCYHEAAARHLAKRLGGTISRETVGKTVKIRIRY